ncbi:hypothetical protein IAT38_006957 [Cryptococcus sp. DSM 104549]
MSSGTRGQKRKNTITADTTLQDRKWESVPPGIAESDCATVISSDGVTFRIPKYHLQSSSAVFCHLIGECTLAPPGTSPHAGTDTHVIRLENKEFETADVLRHLLNILDGSWAPHPMMPHELRSHLTAFADKWECKMVYLLMIRSIREYFHSDPSLGEGIEPFILGLRYQEYEVADEIFRQGHYTWGSADAGDAVDERKRCQSGYSILNPEGWSLDICERVGAYHMWVMSRVASMDGKGDDPKTYSYEEAVLPGEEAVLPGMHPNKC